MEAPEQQANEGTVTCRLKALEKTVLGRGGFEQRLEEVEAHLADLTNDYCVIKDENRDLLERNTYLESVVVKQQKEIDELKKSQTDAKYRSMRNNIIVHNVIEKANENTEDVVRSFLSSKNILEKKDAKSIRFDRVHRMGPSGQKHPRPIVARLTFFKDKERILQSWREQGKHDFKQPRVTQQLPPETVAQRGLNYHIIEETKDAAGDEKKNLKISTKEDKVYINNQLIKPRVIKPPLDKLLCKDEGAASNIPSEISPMLHERGSNFQAQAFQIKSINDVRLTYERVLRNPMAARASHNILAYKVGNLSGWVDDGEHGVGRFLVHWMKEAKIGDACIVVTRNYGGTRLGAKRFELMRDVAKASYSKLAAKM